MDRRNDGRNQNNEFSEKLIKLNRVAKVVKGGRRFSFSALMVVGDRKGKVGFGFGKANDVSEAIRKAVEKSKQNMIELPMKKGTIPHQIIGKFKSASILMKPASPGTGIIAGGTVRAIFEAGGMSDILSKSLGSQNEINVVKATFNGLENLMDVRVTARNRGKTVEEFWG